MLHKQIILAKLLLRKKWRLYKRIHWTLKIPALGVILVYLFIIPSVLLADKMRTIVNFLIILALICCVYVNGRISGLRDGTIIGINEGVGREGVWRYKSSPYLTSAMSWYSHHSPTLQNQLISTFDSDVEEFQKTNKFKKRFFK